MKTLLKFELGHYFKKPGFCLFLILLVGLGIFTGAKFALSLSPDIYKNSAYTIAYMVGFLSLLCIFFTTVFATQIIFREREARFNLILYAMPIRKSDYLWSKFTALFAISFVCFALVVFGFAIGQLTEAESGSYGIFHTAYYVLPLLIFGLVNTLFCTAVLYCIGWLSENKFMVYVSGLFIYILYMVMLIFSGSPMMAKSMPQSETTIKWSAALDPFGLSGYFLQTSNWTIAQRNTELLLPSGIFLSNRIGIMALAAIFLWVAFRKFTFFTFEKKAGRKIPVVAIPKSNAIYKTVVPLFNWKSDLAALFSFIRLDLKYTVNSIPFALICLGLAFCVSMEIFGAIEKGIRIPQKYASSGLMAQTIIDNFHALCLIVVLFYAHEIIWRSRNTNFNLIENTTPASTTVWFFSKWLTLNAIIFALSTLMVVLGIVFQLAYDYPHFDWVAYAGVYLFNSLPLMASAGLIIVLQKVINHKYAGLAVIAAIMLFSATSLGKSILGHPLLRFQMPFNGLYSDMNGYGTYAAAFGWRLLFGFCLVIVLAILVTQFKNLMLKPKPAAWVLFLVILGCFSAQKVTENYLAEDNLEILKAQAHYEKNYRKFQTLAQPIITDVSAAVDLFPQNSAYRVKGKYILQNKTDQPIRQILVNFSDDLKIDSAYLISGDEQIKVNGQYAVINLKKALLPNANAEFHFSFYYQWCAVNGHKSFNAIVENGTFLRISRYFPQFGYDPENEIADEKERKKFHLAPLTQITKIDAPVNATDDFIRLNMTISTDKNQTAIGVGELKNKWRRGNRNYFTYQTTSPIPFRFAVSSAHYAVQTAKQNGKTIEVYFHPSHGENVAHLIRNAQLTLAYCEANFGKYPFQTIRFAEVSGFTRGFAATAYPASIYMPEDMIFHANINADKQQDVINELAGHELAHLWWGNSQIAPDDREGAAMLTETLAMYTELMLVKSMHGKKRVLENVKMHLGMYLGDRGFTEENPLFKVHTDDIHLSYSKGLVVMYQLAELIGEQKVNLALRHLLQHHAYPRPKAVATDFINELYAVTNTAMHPKIDDLFKKITTYSFKVHQVKATHTANQYQIQFDAEAHKYDEDGKGKASKVMFTDTVTIALLFENGTQRRFEVEIRDNKLSFSVQSLQKPIEITVDPDEKMIKTDPQNSYPL